MEHCSDSKQADTNNASVQQRASACCSNNQPSTGASALSESPTPKAPRTHRPSHLGVDIGGSSIKVGILDITTAEEGPASLSLTPAFQQAGVLPTKNLATAEACLQLAYHIASLASLHMVQPEEVMGIGIAVPGAIDANNTLRLIPNVNLSLPALDKALTSVFPDAHLTYINDANAAAFGEWQELTRTANQQAYYTSGGFPAASSTPAPAAPNTNYTAAPCTSPNANPTHSNAPQNLLFVALGTGVGGGIIADGSLVRGAHGAAGEIGHICIEPGGRPCNCGLSGCLEQYAATAGIMRTYNELRHSRYPKAPVLPSNTGAAPVFEAAKHSEACALATINAFASTLGCALAQLACMFDPEVIIVGGGIANAFMLYEAPLRAAFVKAAINACKTTEIRAAALGSTAGMHGAAYYSYEQTKRG